jgi:DNA polymerase-3 subunit epsilon
VHGITDDKVKDAPKFAEIVTTFVDFIGDAPIIAHNAQFDRNFIDARTDPLRPHACSPEAAGSTPWCWPRSGSPACTTRWTPCASASTSAWPTASLHGALIDARLLAEVYLELQGGKERRLDLSAVAHRGHRGGGPGGGRLSAPRPPAGAARQRGGACGA